MGGFASTAGSGYQNAPNVLSGGLANQPDWTPSNLDPGTAALIDQINQQGLQNKQQIVGQEMAGTSPTIVPATGGAVAQQQATLGGTGNDAVTTALNNRANQIYATQFNQLQNQAVTNAPAIQGHLMSKASEALMQQQQINDELNRQQLQATYNKWAMRNKVIGQIFGAAGQGAGTYMGMQNKSGRGGGGQSSSQSTDMSNSWAGSDSGSGMGESYQSVG